jgi:hypothetical protein
VSNFTLLWSKTLDSSIWRLESKETRLVWVTLLMMKDADGVVLASKVGLADRAKVSMAECMEALKVLLGPDANDTSGVEGGRRLREIPGGWQVINHDYYRFSTEAKRAFWRESKALQRAKDKPQPKAPRRGKPLPREQRYEDALSAGDEAGADAIAAEGLPVAVPAAAAESIPLGSGEVEGEE